MANKRSVQNNHPNRTPEAVTETDLHLRRDYYLGPIRTVWYLERYHGLRISDAGVYRIFNRNGVNRLPGGTRVHKIHTKRYNKQVPGHQIQMNFKLLIFIDKSSAKTRRFQCMAIDDAKRIRALKIYERHNQANAINFVDHVIATFPFRIQEIRTDNCYEFRAKFHWHVEDKGICHAYIKPSSPQLNGKVE